MTESEVKVRLGKAARKIAYNLTNKELREKMNGYMVCSKTGKPTDVMGFVFKEAFGGRFMSELGHKSKGIYDSTWVLYKVLNVPDGLLASIFRDITLTNDSPRRGYLGRVVELLDEMADYCLYEGTYHPSNFWVDIDCEKND